MGMKYRVVDNGPDTFRNAKAFTNKKEAFKYVRELKAKVGDKYDVHVDSYVNLDGYKRLMTI